MWPHVNILRSTKCEFRMYVRIHCIFCKKHILYYKKNKCFPSELILTNWKFFFFTWLSVFKQKYETYTPPPAGLVTDSLFESWRFFEDHWNRLSLLYMQFRSRFEICIQIYMHLHDSLFISAHWKIRYLDSLFIQTGHFIRFVSVFEPVL